MGFGNAYRDGRERFTDLVSATSPEDLEKRVPACPDWNVKELFAHVVGVATDTIAGNVEGVGSKAWTSRQVEERSDHSVTQLIEEWNGVSPKVEELAESIHPAVAGGLVGDLVTHEQDARGALAQPGGRDSEAFDIALDSFVRFFGRRVKEAGLPALRVSSGSREWIAGKGEPAGSVAAEPFELLRSLTGRRTKAQIRKLEWEGDPEPYLEIFSMYGHPQTELEE